MYLNKNRKIRTYQGGGDIPSEKTNLPPGVSGYSPSGMPIYTQDQAGQDAQYRDMFSKNRGRLTPSSKVNKSEGFSDEYNRVLQYKEDNRTIGDNRQIAKLPKWVKGPQEGYGRVVISPEMAMQMEVDINTGKVSKEVAEEYFRFLQGYREGVIGDGIVDYKLDIPANWREYEYEDPDTGETKIGRRKSNILRGHGYKKTPGQGAHDTVSGHWNPESMMALIELSERINNPKKQKNLEEGDPLFKGLKLPETDMIKEGYGNIIPISEEEEEEEEFTNLSGEKTPTFIDNEGADATAGFLTETGTEGEDVEVIQKAREKKLTDQSTSAIVNSFKTGKHIKTGEEYNQADLQRDADIIKSRFGQDAYDNLLAEVGNITQGGPGSDVSAVTVQKRSTGVPFADQNILKEGFAPGGGTGVDFNQLRSAIGGKEAEEEEGGSRSQEFVDSQDDDDTQADANSQLVPGTLGYQEVYGGPGPGGGGGGWDQGIRDWYSGWQNPGSSSSIVSPFKTGGKLKKYDKGGSVKGFYDKGGNLVKGFDNEKGTNYKVPKLFQGGHMSYSMPKFFEKGDIYSGGNPIGQLKAQIEHYKTIYDPKDPAQVAKLDEMEARLDKMTFYDVKRTNVLDDNILDTTADGSNVEVEEEIEE